MLHYSCDVCKRPIHPNSDVHHIVKIEVFPAVEDVACGCDDLDDFGTEADHLEEMQELLEQLDESEDPRLSPDAVARSMRFDLCEACRQRFVKNPLGIKSGKYLDFSKN
jgi:hypothetical protein